MLGKLNNKKRVVGQEMMKATDEAVAVAQKAVEVTEQEIEKRVAPVREGLLKRFPVLSILAVTFGVTATLVGMEQLIVQNEWLYEHPTVVLSLGIGILVLTGTLYKKLG